MTSTISLWIKISSKDILRSLLVALNQSTEVSLAVSVEIYFLQVYFSVSMIKQLKGTKRLKYVLYREQLEGNLANQHMRRISLISFGRMRSNNSCDPTSAKTIALCMIVCKLEIGKNPLFKSKISSC